MGDEIRQIWFEIVSNTQGFKAIRLTEEGLFKLTESG